ncbi:hypothetical protein ABH931_006999 [Streptacidiphilus sp. MAP12-33]|uniref:hypothetical protein n=1 Tax=Streptacidiphilus sp. MAP12-33 TaxID=3156266 RepID=UPI003513C66E
MLSGALLGRVFEQSPGSTVLFSRWHHSVFADAEHGLVDLLVHGAPPPPLRTRTLFEVADHRGRTCGVALVQWTLRRFSRAHRTENR